ncbi:MAG: hypothetical protein IKV35_00140 [Clostridia bacterium]|nr:hypothetical protein [Clostridia bacterium]
MKRLIKMIAWMTAMMMTVGMIPFSTVSAASPVSLSSAADDVKLLGRTTVGKDGIEPHSTGAGIAFYSECSGDITLTMTGKPTKFASLYLAIFVDGEMHRVEFKGQVNRSSTQELVIAEGLSNGKHKIEIVRDTEENYGSYVWESITLSGDMTPVEDAPLLIEFVGDSLTAGYASYPYTDETKGLSVEHPALEAGTKTYAYLTAQALGADFQSVCASGYGVVKGYNSDGVTVPKLYEYAGYYHNKKDSGKWAFERTADVVVINLGSNDANRGTTAEQMATEAKAFTEAVRAHNPDAAIVWMTGVSSAKFDAQFETVVSELGGAEKGYYFVNLPEGSSGGAGHPSIEEHAQTAQALTQYLKENVLPAEEETTPTVPSVSVPDTDGGSNNTVLWIVLGAIGAVLVLAAVAVVLVVVMKKKTA